MAKPISGYVLFQGVGFDGQPIVVIATMLSANQKTGGMVQVWVLRSDVSPGDAVRSGRDVTICGTCPFRSGNGCYVVVHQAPRQIWATWRPGGYVQWNGDPRPFANRLIRWGAYGDPVLIPLPVVNAINGVVAGHTGYTHAWRTRPAYRDVFMASVDSPAEREEARAAGWRTFRIRCDGAPLLPGEFSCPASGEEGFRLTCSSCLACDGAGDNPARATPAIITHGQKRGRMPLPTV